MNWCLLSKPHFLLTLLSVTDTLKAHIFAAGLILIILASPQSFHLLVRFLSFTSFRKISHLHLIIFTFLAYFICPSFSRYSSSNLPLPLSLSFLGTTLSLISVLSLSPGLMSFPLHWLPSSPVFSHLSVSHFSYSVTQSSLSFFFSFCKTLYSFLPSSICVNTTPSPRFPCKHAQSPATPLQSL